MSNFARALASVALLAAALSCTTTSTPPGSTAAATAAPMFPGAGVPAAIPTTTAFVSLEGPFWVAAGGYLLFSDVVEANAPAAHIYRFEPAARTFSVLPYPPPLAPGQSTSTNGLAVDRSGALLACERYHGRLIRVTAGGTSTVLADRWPATEVAGQPSARFNAPNDLAVRSDGNIYFTDSDWGIRPGADHGPMAVYRLAPDGKLERILELTKPNGIALSPDQQTLYFGSDVQAKVWKASLDASGAAGAPTLLIDGATVAGGFKVPDGICVDDAGNLYVTNNADEIKAIVVFDPAGRQLGRIPFPDAPSNCTFGGAERKTMYVTTLHAIYEVRMPTPGLP
jgi:gluconolactonase